MALGSSILTTVFSILTKSWNKLPAMSGGNQENVRPESRLKGREKPGVL